VSKNLAGQVSYAKLFDHPHMHQTRADVILSVSKNLAGQVSPSQNTQANPNPPDFSTLLKMTPFHFQLYIKQKNGAILSAVEESGGAGILCKII